MAWRLQTDGTDRVDARVREYWSWFAAALFLLTTVDMITTMYASYRFGVAGEANPLIQWSLMKGPIVFTTTNLSAIALATVMFDGVIGFFERISDRYARYAAAGIEAWLGGLLAAGLLIFANNLTVIFFGRSLL